MKVRRTDEDFPPRKTKNKKGFKPTNCDSELNSKEAEKVLRELKVPALSKTVLVEIRSHAGV